MSGIGRGGTGVLKVDGKEVATQKMEHTLPLILQWDETFDIGSDTGTPVDDKDYQVPFTFTGKLNKLTLKIDRPQLSPEDIKKLEAAPAEQQGQRVALDKPDPGTRRCAVLRGRRTTNRQRPVVDLPVQGVPPGGDRDSARLIRFCGLTRITPWRGLSMSAISMNAIETISGRIGSNLKPALVLCEP